MDLVHEVVEHKDFLLAVVLVVVVEHKDLLSAVVLVLVVEHKDLLSAVVLVLVVEHKDILSAVVLVLVVDHHVHLYLHSAQVLRQWVLTLSESSNESCCSPARVGLLVVELVQETRQLSSAHRCSLVACHREE